MILYLLYRNGHRSQYGGSNSTITRTSGCTWTSAANGADAATGGAISRTPDQVHALVKTSEETSPATPGWSIPDAVLAMKRLGVPLENRSGKGWGAVVAALDAGCGVILQGDSDRFAANTCSGAFDGNHAIYVHPERDSAGRQRINDPICPGARYESRTVLRAYAEKLSPSILFAVFTTNVPEAPMPDLKQYLPGYTITVKATSNVRDEPKLAGLRIRTLTAPETWTITGIVTGDKDVDGSCTTTDWFVRWNAGRWEYTSRCNVTAGPTAPVTDCTAAVKAAVDPIQAKLDEANRLLGEAHKQAEAAANDIEELELELKLAPAKERDRIANLEARRIRSL